jgi:pyridoxal 5'-phosphate synthase pdxS subunit
MFFSLENPLKTAQGIVAAVLHYNDAKILAEVSENLGDPMKGIGNLKVVENFAEREAGNMKK